MKLSVIIPAHDEELYIADCLDSVVKNAGNRLHEIIVVDNASTDRTPQIASARTGVRVVFEPRKGPAYARQRGLDEATGDLLAFIDADARVPPNWGTIAHEAFEQDRALACLSGPYRFYDGPKLKRWTLNTLCWAIPPILFRLIGYMMESGNYVVKKDVLRQAGGFDSTIGLFGDDTDAARRISLHGKLVYRNDFYIFTSGRRFYVEGVFKSSWLYFINILWVVLSHRPFSKSYSDIRQIFPRS